MAFLSKKTVKITSGLGATALLVFGFQNCGKTVQFSAASKNLKSASFASTAGTNSSGSSSIGGSSSGASSGTTNNTGNTGSNVGGGFGPGSGGGSGTTGSPGSNVTTQPTPAPAPAPAPAAPTYSGHCASENNDYHLRYSKIFNTRVSEIINGTVPVRTVCDSFINPNGAKTVLEVSAVYYYIMDENDSVVCDEQIDIKGSIMNGKNFQLSSSCQAKLQECKGYSLSYYNPDTHKSMSGTLYYNSSVDFGPSPGFGYITVNNGRSFLWKGSGIIYKRLGGPGTVDYTTPNAHLMHPGCESNSFPQ